MTQPLVIAYHLIWTGYGWWLPNDPRGSSSKSIRNDIVGELGTLHHGRKWIQPCASEVREFHRAAGNVLEDALLQFESSEISVVADVFARVIASERYTCYACATMPDHVHILIRKHRDKAEEMIAKLQGTSRAQLRESGLRRFDHPVWGGPGWKVFLDHPDEIRRTIKYIEANPGHMGLPAQRWSFVTAYDGWPLHHGHSPNSPYAKALRAVGRYP